MQKSKSVWGQIFDQNPRKEGESQSEYTHRILALHGTNYDNVRVQYGKYRRRFKTVAKNFDKHGNLTSYKKQLQPDPIEIPDNMELERITHDTLNGRQFLKYKVREEDGEYTIDQWLEELADRKQTYTIQRSGGRGVGVYLMSDFHLGAYIGKIIKTPDFNYNVIEAYFKDMVEEINAAGHAEVYVGMLGDFIESFTGLNHKNSWKGLSKNSFGVKAVKNAHAILRDNVYTKINNLKWVGFVSGNHDRTSEKAEGDEQGEVAELMQWLFELEIKGVQSEWSPLLISKEIDGINYILTHGHLGISNQEVSQLIFQYGKQGIYNVFAKGHKHSREMKKTYLKSLIKIDKFDVVNYDTADYRAITVPPMFTGNFYSESNGWSSTAGFVKLVNNGRGKPIFTDYTL
jgi:predicted phosphodiesterase